MASGTRSSKRKSSPSLKKKRRTKDRSKKRSKLGGGKSKKVYRRESSDSYSDDESLSSDSKMQCSSTDSDRRRSRSRSRKDMSKLRKKSRGRRVRSESSEDTVCERRTKRSKKSKDTDAKKKRTRRKRRREPSVSSSSRSVSCSTCGSSDDSEGEHEGTGTRRGRNKRDLDEDRSWRGHRSRSRSPCRLDVGDDSNLIEEKGPDEYNPRRLRSVIIFAKESEEADTELVDPDVHKEEIIYDHDEYPSPKSNDSNDGDTKREACPVRTGYMEDQHDEMVGPKVRISELAVSRGIGVTDRDVNASAFSGAGLGDSLEEQKTKASTCIGSNATDLEAVLRQKALENLRKFKGGLPGNAKKPVSTKSSNDGEVKQSSTLIDDVECRKKDQEGSVGGVGALSVPRQTISTVGQHSSRTIQASSSLNRPAAEKLQTLPQHPEIVNPSEEGSADDVDTLKGSEVGALALKEEHLGANKLAKQAFPTQESPMLSIPTTETLPLPVKDAKRLADSVADVNEKHETGASTLIQCLGSNKLDRQMTPIPESSVLMSVPAENKGTIENVQSFDDTKIVTEVDKTTTVGETSNTKENKDEDSQFQQKTMSVMRGGEMVQVSYKVYIPKNAKTLARRKLKR